MSLLSYVHFKIGSFQPTNKMSSLSSEDGPIILSEEEDAADFFPALPLNPATPPEVIEISSEEENDANLDSSDTSSNVHTDAETEVQAVQQAGAAVLVQPSSKPEVASGTL